MKLIRLFLVKKKILYNLILLPALCFTIDAKALVHPNYSISSLVKETVDLKGVDDPIVDTPAEKQSVCSGTPYVYTITGSEGATFTWTVEALTDVTFSETSGTDEIAFTPTSTAIDIVTATIIVTPTLDGETGIKKNILVEITPTATATIPSSIDMCSGENLLVDFSPVIGGTIEWEVKNNPTNLLFSANSGDGSISNVKVDNSSDQTLTTTIQITLTGIDGCADGTSQNITINVAPLAKVDAPSEQQVACSGSPFSFTITGTSGATYFWQQGPLTDVEFLIEASDMNSNEISFTPTSSSNKLLQATVTVTPTLGGCEGEKKNISINILPNPTVIVPSGIQEVCSSDTLDLDFFPSNDATVKWEFKVLPSSITVSTRRGSGNMRNVEFRNSANEDVALSLTVTPELKESDCNNGIEKIVEIKVRGSQQSEVTEPMDEQVVCLGTPYTYSPSGTQGASYVWSVADLVDVNFSKNSGTGDIEFTPTSTSSGPFQAVVTITPQLNGCPGKPRDIIVNISKAVDITVPTENQEVCSGDFLNLNFTSSEGETLNWGVLNIPSEITMSEESGTGSINNVKILSSALVDRVITIRVAPNEIGCSAGSVKDVKVSIKAFPIVNNIPEINEEICAGNEYSFIPTGLEGTSFDWEIEPIDDVIFNQTNGSGEVSFVPITTLTTDIVARVRIIPSLNGCQGDVKTLPVTIKPSATVTASPSGTQSICTGDSLMIVLNGNLTDETSSYSTSVDWEIVTLPDGIESSESSGTDAIDINLTNTTDNDLTMDIKATPIISGASCKEGIPKIIKVIVKAKPKITLPASLQQVCPGVKYTHKILGTEGANFDWEIETPINNVTFDDTSGSGIISFTPTSLSNTDVDINIKIKPSRDGCEGKEQILVVKLTKTISIPQPVVEGKLNICAGESLDLSLLDTSGNPNVKLSWELGEVTNLLGATSGNGSSITDSLDLIGTNQTGSVVYRVISTLNIDVTSNCGIDEVVQRKSVTVTVVKRPQVDLSNDSFVFCAGDNINIPFSSSSAGAVYNWELLSTPTNVSIDKKQGVGDINLQVSNTSTEKKIFQFSVIPKLESFECTGFPKYFTVTILPEIIDFSLQGEINVCAGDRLNLAIEHAYSEVFFKWTALEDNVTGASSASRGLLINDQLNKIDNNLEGFVVYTVTPVWDGCNGVDKEVKVNVISVPQVIFTSFSNSIVNGIVDICSNQALDVLIEDPTEGNITNFSWRLSTPNPFINTTQSTGNDRIQELNLVHDEAVVQKLIYTIESTGANCQGLEKNLVVNVYPQPEFKIIVNKNIICSGDLFVLRAALANDVSNWEVVITKENIVGSTLTGQLSTSNFSRTVNDVLVNNAKENQIARYKITARPIRVSSPCQTIEEYREVTVLPASDFSITVPSIVCPSIKELLLTTDNHVNTLGESMVSWTNPLIENDPKILSKPDGTYIYDVFSSTPTASRNISLRATVKASGNCGAISKDYQFTIYDTPLLELENIDSSTTIKNTDAPFELRLKNGLLATFSTRIGEEVVNNGKFIPSAIDDDSYGRIVATYTDTVTKCSYTKNFDLRVYKVPTVSIKNTNLRFCADDTSVIRLSGTPLINSLADNGKEILSSRWVGLGVVNQTDGTATINLSNLFNERNEVSYIVSDRDKITGQEKIEFIRNPLPNPANFSLSVVCDTEIRFIDTTGATTGINDIVAWYWEFGDFNTSTLQNPTHSYSQPGTYNVTLEVSTKEDCRSQVIKQVVISPFIQPNFRWEGLCQGSEVSFFDMSLNVNRNVSYTYTWNFGDGSGETQGMSSLESIRNVKHVFKSAGSYLVTLKIGSGDCVDEKKILVNVHKSISIGRESTYLEGFETTDGGWIPGSLKEIDHSWEHGVPLTSAQINNASEGAKVWSTNLSGEYNDGEISWITSPCFNLKNMKTPKLSMDLFLDTVEKLAGASMEISYDSGVSWKLLGNINTEHAYNWYKDNTIAGDLTSTGNTNLARQGWTGIYPEWKRVIYDLDREFIIQNRASKEFVLRLVFAAPQGQVLGKNGVALDNFIIRNQAKKILVENMLNYNDIDSRRDELQFDSRYKDYENEIIKINYHVNTPGTDKFNLDNPADPAARKLYYGIDNEKYYIINGQKLDKENNAYILNKFTEIALQETNLDVNVNIKKNIRNNSYSIEITSKVIETNKLNKFKNNYTLFCIVVQPEIWSIPSSNGTNPIVETVDKFYGVMKKMLPDAGGTPLILQQDGDFKRVNLSYYPKNIYNKKTAEFVVFIQNVITKEIEYVEKFDIPDIVNALILSLNEEEELHLADGKFTLNPYPIPFNYVVYIPLPESVNQSDDFELSITNAIGQPELVPMRLKNNSIILDTSELKSGIYSIILNFINTSYRKKIVKLND